MKRKAIRLLVTGFLFLVLAPAVFAGSVTFIGGGDGYSWSDPKNWSTGALPGSSDDVTIPAVANNPTIQITVAAGPVQIHSLNSALAVTISNGSLTLASPSVIKGLLNVSGSSSTLNASAQTTLLADTILVNNGAQVSFPNVTSYTVPTGLGVQWVVQDSGSTLTFPNLTTITGPATPNTGFSLIAQYSNTTLLSLPALTTITKPDDGDAYANSGVGLFAHNGATVSAPNLTTFNDNDRYPDSSLNADGGGVLALPKLLAPVGVFVNLDAESHPEQFTSLVGARSIQINSGTVVLSKLTSITGFSTILVNNGAQVSFPNVTSYTVPTGLGVQWVVQDSGSTLTFPNLTTITGPATPNTGFSLIAQYSNTTLLSLPALTTITKPDDGDAYANSGVGLFAHNGATVSAPNLTTFNDNDRYPDSSLNADGGGVLALPKLLAPVGVFVNLDAESHPEQFTSLVGARSIQINSGTVVLSKLTSITGFSTILVNNGAQVSFPNVTSYTVPTGLGVQWVVQDSGSTLTFPNLTTITGPATPNTGFSLIAQYSNTTLLSLPALTTITKPDDGDAYANSGVGLFAHNGATVSAPNLTTFNDNDRYPDSSLNADGGGVLALPKLLAPVGVFVNLDAESHPEQFTSLVGARSIQINSGTVVLSKLTSITGFSTILVNNGAQVSFPNVTSYTVPTGLGVQWVVQDSGSTLTFPNLTTITGPATPNTGFSLIAQYSNTTLLSLPALTTITKPDDGDAYANSGVGLFAHNGATVSAPNLTTFNDNDRYPDSSLNADGGGIISVDQLTSVIGVNVNLGYALTIDEGQNYIGYGSIQDGVYSAGLLSINSPGRTLQINGPLSSTGTVKVTNGGTLSITGDFTSNDSGLLTLTSGSTLSVTGDFLGTTTNTAGADPLGTVLLNGGRPSAAPQHLEAMSRDLGAVAAGFTQNFVFGTLALASNTYVQLVDRSRNTTSTSPECVYANSVIVPAGCTLDLNGLHLYARAVQVAGTVLHGTITQIPNAGALVLDTPTPGILSVAGQLDEWTFFLRANRSVSVLVNPGTTGFAVPVAPQLQWANVQLLDPNNNVLASGFSANAGDIVSLQNIVVPADGTYKIHVNAPTSNTSATGNYIVGAWDSTPNVQSLTLNQPVVGQIATAFAVDQWTFSGVAGQQIQFQLTGDTTPGLAFDLNGPGGYNAFTALTTSSMLIDLPASGTYTLNAYGLNGATGGYGFAVKQTSVSPLALNSSYNGTWVGSGQAQLFVVPVNIVDPLLLLLSDPASSDHTEIYARFGAAPTRQTFDYAANGPGANHSLLVPSAVAGSWYVLVYGESIPSSSGSFTLQAKAQEVFIAANSTSQSASNVNTMVTLTGAGFGPGSVVSFIAANGTAYTATTSSTDLPTQITATFAAGTLPAGTYSIQVTEPDGSTAQLPSSIIIAATGRGVLETHLDIPNPIGRHIASTLYVTYKNTGNAAMPAPLLNVTATNPSGVPGAFLTLDPALITSGFWTSATPLGYSQSVQILASGATPGVLQPGETMQVPIYYGGWINSLWSTSGTFNFYVTPVQADDPTPVDWASLESTTNPAGIPAAAWHIIYANLLSQLGTTSGGYVQLLDKNAIYLGQLGRNVTDISKLWGFAVTQALGIFPMQDLAGTTDDSLPTVGKLFLSFGRSFRNSIAGRFQAGPLGLGWVTPWQRSLSIASDGTITISLGNGSKSMYQPDSRYAGKYFSQTGDHSVLTAASGGYQLTAVDGTVAFFSSTGQLSYLQDPNGNKITATYSGGYLTGLTASSGASFTIAYNGAGLISTLTDSAGRVTTYTYDAPNQHLMSVLSYNGQTTSYSYDTTPGSASLNALTTINSPNGLQENLSYDNSGRVMEITANGGAVPKAITYSVGQVNVTDATPATSSIYFDENGQTAKKVDALGNPTFFDHDSSYNVSSVTNALGNSASYSYDSVGNITTETNFLGNATSFIYGGPQHQLTQLTDAKGNRTVYTYNTTGQQTGTTFANGNGESTIFDPLGNALTFVNAAGEPIQYLHNAVGQLTRATFADGSSYTYAYDGEGKLTSAVNAFGSIVFTYNSTGLLTEITYPSGLYLKFTYDSEGRRSSLTDQTGFTTIYDYDALGRLSDLKDGGGNVIVRYAYDTNGRLSQKTNANGTYTTYQYDAGGQVLHLVNFALGGAINSRFDDTYNSLGLKSSEATLDGSWTYTYDANGQLIHAVFASINLGKSANQDLTYAYDAVGNRVNTVLNGVTTAYVANSMNQYSSVGGAVQSYDAKGNLLSNGVNSFEYNVQNQVVLSTTGTTQQAYQYNALGQLFSSSIAGVTTQNLIDLSGLGNMIGTFDSSGSSISHYFHGVGLVSQVTHSGQMYSYDSDCIGSIVGLTNSDGLYVNSYSYSPFGSTMNSAAVNNPYTFIGLSGVEDGTNGVAVMRRRFYVASTGRFSSPDPSGLLGGDVNLYSYTGNNPTNLVDPSGLSVNINTIATGAGQIFGGGRSVVQTIGGALLLSEIPPAAAVNLVYGITNSLYKVSVGTTNVILGIAGRDTLPIPGSLPGLTRYIYNKAVNGDNNVGTYFKDNPSDTDLGDNDDNNVGTYFKDNDNDGGGGDDDDFPFPLPDPDPFGPFPDPPLPPMPPDPGDPTYPGQPTDPNGLYGPSGYGTANFVTNMGNAFAYRVTFENDPEATSPAQIVTITDNLSSSLDWTTFRLTGIGFGDNNLVSPPGSQHYQTTVQMTYNGQTFNVQIETGIHGDTGQVYATFTSIDPNTSLPPSNVLTGFLPPEDGTGRGSGYLTYTVSPKASVANTTVIRNVAYITFDGNQPIATDQVDDNDPSKGTDPTKEAPVTIDTTVPTAQITALPSHDGANIAVSWSGSDAGGSGIASYTVYVSNDGGQTYTPWLTNTPLTSGVYTGTPGHTYMFYVVATSNVGTVEPLAQAQVDTTSTTVDFAPDVTSATVSEAMQGQPFMYAITGDNSPTSFGASGLPAGLSVNTANGLISGTPTQAGVFSVALSATNGSGTGTATLSLTVDPAPIVYPVITSGTTAAGVLGQPFSYQITATNDPATFNATGLPPGLNIDTTSGLISGTPIQVGAVNVALSATNPNGTGTAALTLTITPPDVVYPVITSAVTATALLGQPFSYQITATNSPTSYNATALPEGLSIDTAAGVISGTPTQNGIFAVNLTATNASGTGMATLTLTVGPTSAITPVITSALVDNGQADVPFSYQITATNNPTGFDASGLPDGLTINKTSGLISGTPSVTGLYTIALSATNEDGMGAANLILTISTAPLPIVTVTATTPKVTAGTGATGVFTITLSRQLTTDLTVSYVLKGSAENGTDYQKIKSFKKIKAGKTKVNLKVVPEGKLPGASPKVVKLVLESDKTYTLGTTKPVKVKIFKAP